MTGLNAPVSSGYRLREIGDYVWTRLPRVARNPAMVARFADHHVRRYLLEWSRRRLFQHVQAQLRGALEATPPVRVAGDGAVEVHTLCGANGVVDAIFSLKTFYRFAPEPYALVVHEDGSLTGDGLALVERHFPGARVVRRADADRAVLVALEQRGLRRCAEFRRTSVMGLKLFDLQYYGQGKRVCYVDSDILFHQRPDEIFAALAVPDEQWVDHYNEDVRPCYTWSEASLRREFGVGQLERPVNTGLFVIRREAPEWEVYERCLAMPERNFWVEQSLWAVDFALRGGRALPPEYDVCFRRAWSDVTEPDRPRVARQRRHGAPVVSQHYCGGPPYRALFYDRALAIYRSEMARPAGA